jgi:hypothetical protein
VYLELGTESDDSAKMEFNFVGDGNRKYEIKVTQILCDAAQK